ncbi:MAG: lipid A biosynthesis acyltransferase, partial [Acidaminococcales bacterium]|nr:lipid A biosynthesis acyltransferase [Acidaminococcales bacterium]
MGLITVLYWVYRGIVKTVSLLPYSLVLAIGRMLGVLYYLLIKKQVNLARDAICRHLMVSREKAGEITKAMCRNIGMTFMEILYMPALNPANIRRFVKLEREDLLREAIAEKKGVVMLAIHMDNWEWLGAALSLYGYP